MSNNKKTPEVTHDHKHFDNLRVEKLPESEAVIVGELTLEVLSEARAEALKALGERIEIPGFRKGNVPENILVKNVGEMKILEEVAEVALGHEYESIMRESKLSPIGRPHVAITKLAPGIPLEFKITVTLEPEFKLPDYKKISKEIKSEGKLDVSDAEVDAVLEEIKKQGWNPELKEGEDLRTKAKENLLEEKKFRAKEKKRLTIVEGLVKATEIKIPKLLIESELDRMVGQFKDDVTRHGMKWDDYMKSIKKTEADLRDEWRTKAEDRSKAELIMLKIAETEKLEPTTEELESETKHILSHHPEADTLRVRIFVYQQLKNQKVLEFLETL
ncbi:MAG: trigger factor [Minisyncoccota bacterium]